MDKASFTGQLTLSKDSRLWGFHVTVPNSIAKLYINDSNRRVIITYNNSNPIHQALIPNGNGGYFLTVNKEIRSKQGLTEGSEIKVTIKKDNSKYGMAMPEEFSELLLLDPEGSEVFHTITIGKQRSLIHLVGKCKRSETRINKALVILNYLKEVKGKLDFKELNQAFKASSI